VSSKSKHPPKKKSFTRIFNEALAVFLWAWINVTHPAQDVIDAVAAEIRNVAESLSARNLSVDMIIKQLEQEHGIRTDWLRRDRG